MTLALSQICDLAPDEPELAPLSTYLAVEAGACRWPLGPDSELGCCGRLVARGSYCENHSHRAYRRHESEEAREAKAEHFAKLLYSHKFSKPRGGLTLNVRATPEELGF